MADDNWELLNWTLTNWSLTELVRVYGPGHLIYVVPAESRVYVIDADGPHELSTIGDPLLTEAGLQILAEDGDLLTTESGYRSRRYIIPEEIRVLEVPNGV